jgi:CheY-like chemotaxis protein
MRLRITRQPPAGDIADLVTDDLHVGGIYELDTLVASLFLAEGWAEPVSSSDEPPVLLQAVEVLPFGGVVLLVDDEPALRHFARILLSHHGYDVLVARDGKEAIGRLSSRCPDLIVLDLHMPVMNGWQFRAEQRRLPSPLASIPVLLMTGEVDADACAATLDAIGVVKKPFAPNALLDAVGAAIRQHRTNREMAQTLARADAVVARLPEITDSHTNPPPHRATPIGRNGAAPAVFRHGPPGPSQRSATADRGAPRRDDRPGPDGDARNDLIAS